MTNTSLMSKSDLARFLDVSLYAVSDWMRKGCPFQKKGRNVYFYLPDVLSWQREQFTPAPEKPGGVLEEQARVSKARADKLEMENAVTRGELVYSTDAAAPLGSVIVAIKAKILGFGSKIAPRVVACSNVNEVKALIDAAARDILLEIAEIDPGDDGGVAEGDPEGAQTGNTAAVSDGFGVGGQIPASLS